MDNASYHSRLVPGSVGPKTSWLKADIITHMMDNDIVPSELLPGYLSADEVQKQIDAMRLQGSGVSYIAPVWHPPLAVPAREAYERLTKPVLLAACPKLPKEYVVDEMCKQAGVECVRLPPYYCEFNPIELVWAHAKDRVKSQNTEFQLDAAMQIMRAACKEVGPEHWMKLEEHAKRTASSCSASARHSTLSSSRLMTMTRTTMKRACWISTETTSQISARCARMKRVFS
jgi:hypothetical protein